MPENINSKIEGLSSSVKNQLSFNKMIETQLAQIRAAILMENNGKILGQPKNFFEKVNAMTTSGGNSTGDPPNPDNKSRESARATRGGIFFINKNTKRSRRGGNSTARLHRHQLLVISYTK